MVFDARTEKVTPLPVAGIAPLSYSSEVSCRNDAVLECISSRGHSRSISIGVSLMFEIVHSSYIRPTLYPVHFSSNVSIQSVSQAGRYGKQIFGRRIVYFWDV